MSSSPEPRKRIAVVVGSTRPTRICHDIAVWTRAVLAENSSLDYQLVDLAEIALPLLDEPLMAALQTYEHEHTRAWSRLVRSFDGFVFVLPQYNWGYPAPLKNALDYLYVEWHGKPASLLTYGTRGGGRAAQQLLGVLAGLHMRALDHVEAVITEDDVDADWQLVDVDTTLGPVRLQLTDIDSQLIAAVHAAEPDPIVR